MLKRDKIKRAISLTILVIFFYHSFAYIFLYFPSKIIIKYIVQSAINNGYELENSALLIFDCKNLEQGKYNLCWEEEGREFRYNNKLYDVKNKSVIGDSIYIYCYEDVKENILDLVFEIYAKESKKEKNNDTNNFVSLMGLYWEDISYIKMFRTNDYNLPFFIIEKGNFSFISDTPTPPPRFIV